MDSTPGSTTPAARAAEALRWSAARTARTLRSIAAMLGMAGPIAAGALAGHPRFGMVAALGGLALGAEGRDTTTLREAAASLAIALAAGGAGVLAGTAIAGRGFAGSLLLAAVATAAGLAGGMSRRLARATAQLVVMAVIASSLDGSGRGVFGMLVLFLAGGAWTAALVLACRIVAPGSPPAVETRHRATVVQLLRRWRRSLQDLGGWEYALRLGSCLVVAGALQQGWRDHHASWIALTVVLVVRRDGGRTRALQRAAGTVIGVLATGAVLLASGPTAPPPWACVAAIAALSAARPVLLDAHYAAYAAVMTPLVILLLDFGTAPGLAVLLDRLIATFVGCAVALVSGTVFSRFRTTGAA